LSDCSITEEGYSALAETMKSSHLIELDLRGNDPGASGVKLLTDLLQDPDCKLNTLRLLKNPDAVKAIDVLKEVLGKNPLLQRELDLRGKIKGDSGVKQLSALLEDSHYRPETLMLKDCSITEEGCSALSSSFHSNPEHIREMDLSENKFGNSGVQKLCALLQHQSCNLQILSLSDCSITEEGYSALSEALKSSHLIELDLRGNDPGASGVKLLTDLLQDPDCKLKTLRLLKSPEAEEAFKHLNNVLDTNPLLQTDLNLSRKIKGDSGVKQLSALLKDSHCRPETLMLIKCGLMTESCISLSEVLTSQLCFLTELDLSENSLQNSGVMELSKGLKNPCCNLQILRLSACSITEEGYSALAEALKSSHLIELDLRGNDPGASGVKKLDDIQNNPNYKLKTLSGYAPQVGCELEEKERFWSELDEVMESIPTGERVVIGADFNGHVGEGNTGDEEVMGKFGVKERNLEGQMVVDFAKRMDMGVVNTYFQKREEHRVTYKSGGRRTQVDYILCRRGNLKEISDCKVVVGESVARQHRMVVCRMTLMVCKKKRSKIEIEKKTKWWKLKKEECCEEFRQKLRQALGGQVVLPDDWETTAEVIRETGRKVLGVSSGRRKEDKETWWWNEEVQDSIQRKRLAKKKWDMDRTEENRQEYKELQRRVKREVSKAKQKAYDELYTRLDTREGEKDLYRLARQRDRDGKDVQQVRVIKDRDGRVLTSEESVQRRWKEYFEELMNEENEREKRVEGVNSVEQKVDKIRKDEVRKALKRMKSGKAVGPDDIPVEVWKCLGEAAVEFLASLFNRVLESERMPEEWRRSVLVPIFKNKGDVQSCSNYRGIKLMSHTMKLWERVVEARLRKVVEICEQQYGFMPRKSTTDAIFALRILMEKYRDGQRELHCVFVDLEKAYDRVPREELWYCMRKSGVAEKYVRVVQDMYERSRTVVRCAVGQTEEFNVEVGLHQGSALSPFLFAIVMDQLSEEVRQESPWTMMFADDIVICSESREQVEENLERWRFALERRGMKVSRSKTEYMCVNEREGSGTVRLLKSSAAQKACNWLNSVVGKNSLLLKELDLSRKETGDSGVKKLSVLMKDSHCKLQKIQLSECNLTERSCWALHTVLSSESSKLTEVDLSSNPLEDSGVKQLCAGLKSPNCKLEKLSLSDCSITEEGYTALSEALKSSHLIELDLRGNDPGASGVKLLTDLLQDPDCKLTTMKLLKSAEAEEAFKHLNNVLDTNPLLQTDLNLRGKIKGDSGVKQLSALLKDSHCRPETLMCFIVTWTCATKSFRGTNSCMIKEVNSLLFLSRLSDCSITEEGYSALAEALKSSHLIELDLRGNDPGASGVKKLDDIQNNPNYKLKTLRLLKSSAAQKACNWLNSVVGKNSLLLKELDLSRKETGDSGVKKLSVLMKDSHCKFQKIQLSECNLTERSCWALHTVLSSESSKLTEVDLSSNPLEDSGVKQLCAGLKSPNCKLEKLSLSDCSITEEGYTALSEALKSSHLIELDLRGNDPGASGVKLLTDLLQDPDCKLTTMKLLKSPEAEEAFKHLNNVLDTNPLLQTDLNLSGKIKGDSGVKQLSALLKDSHCRPETLMLIKCGLMTESCISLSEVLTSQLCFLTELDLSENSLQNSGVTELSKGLKNPCCNLQILRYSDINLYQRYHTPIDPVINTNKKLLSAAPCSGSPQRTNWSAQQLGKCFTPDALPDTTLPFFRAWDRHCI
ncbi:hypothetical protein QTP70_019265, partial [Hemibagrus guttatus]